jgi:hypothetical protein
MSKKKATEIFCGTVANKFNVTAADLECNITKNEERRKRRSLETVSYTFTALIPAAIVQNVGGAEAVQDTLVTAQASFSTNLASDTTGLPSATVQPFQAVVITVTTTTTITAITDTPITDTPILGSASATALSAGVVAAIFVSLL